MSNDAGVERFVSMATRIELHVFGDDFAQADALGAARRAIEAVDDALTIHRPSAATMANEMLMAGKPASIDDPILLAALEAVDDGYADALGLFDVAADRRSAGCWRDVVLDRSARRVTTRVPLAFDFGGMGKGFALDRAAQVMRAHGVRSALLSAGESSILVIGEHPLGGGWPFSIPHPLDPTQALVEIELTDEALSVSANVGAGLAAPERTATLHPGDRSAITVPRCAVAVAASGTAAEMMSTALMIADEAQARHLQEQAPSARFRFDVADRTAVSEKTGKAVAMARQTELYA